MRLLYLILFILAINAAHGSVQKKPEHRAAAVVKVDTSAGVNIRSFDKATLTKYSDRPEFKYNSGNEELSWWDRLWIRFWAWFWSLFMFKGLSVLGVILNIIEILLIVAAVGGLIYAILKAVGMDPRTLLSKTPPPTVPYSEFFEDINTIDFDTEIEKAVAAHNYRFAVRLLYLKCLKQLSDAGVIAWEIDKTNSQYLYELKNDEQRSAFGLLTRQFEYVWYGEFSINDAVYNAIAHSFRDFNKRGKAV
jgi:hypothetical protein